MALDVITQRDVELLMLAADGSLAFSGETGPHPNACCVIADASGKVLGSAAQRAHGTTACEVLAIAAVPEGAARGGTAYLNLESGDCVGERAAIDALVASGVRRVVVGLKHPLLHWRGCSIAALRAAGVTVAVLGESRCEADPASSAAAYDTCLRANEALLVRGHSGRPLSLLKYAMTLDGKIATHAGHAAWVSCAESRAKVFEQRSWSDAVIVGGNTGVLFTLPLRCLSRPRPQHSPAALVHRLSPPRAPCGRPQCAGTIPA